MKYDFDALKVEYIQWDEWSLVGFFRKKFWYDSKRQPSWYMTTNTAWRKRERDAYREEMLADIMREKRQIQKKDILESLDIAQNILRTDLERVQKRLAKNEWEELSVNDARKIKIAITELRTTARLPNAYSERYIPNDSDWGGHIKPVQILLSAEDADDEDYADDLFDNDDVNDQDVSETIENTTHTDE